MNREVYLEHIYSTFSTHIISKSQDRVTSELTAYCQIMCAEAVRACNVQQHLF